MATPKTADQLKKLFQGAFAGPPTPLKDIPTDEGKRRAKRKTNKKKVKPGK